MASITFKKVYECAAGDHLRLAITGDIPSQEMGIWLPDLAEPISDHDKEVFIRVLLRIARIGRTQNQIKTALTNGYTITI